MLVSEDGKKVANARLQYLFFGALLLGVAFLVAIEIAAWHFRIEGPTGNLLHDVAFGPKRGPLLWGALVMAMVGLAPRERIRCLSLAAGIDLAFFLGRLAGGTRWTFGNGALIVLVGLGGWAAARWTAQRRIDALRGVGIGFLLIMASKISDTFLRITAITQPMVLDEYVATADRSLGLPAWWMGRLVVASGPVGHLILQTVYIQLPVGAIIVAIYQLRKGWPGHHLVRTFLAIGMIGPICYLLFPVVGPVYAFGQGGGAFTVNHVWPNVNAFNLQPHAMRFDAFTPRNCMPSLHTAWAVAIFIHSRRGPRWLQRFGTFWMVATLTATLGFGYHYGVDLVAGVIFCLTIESGLRDPERGWGWFRVRLLLAGSGSLVGLLLAYRFLADSMASYPTVSGPLLLGVMGAMILAFHATFFAPAGSLAAWGRPDGARKGALVGNASQAS